jgi:hypothetical protein
VASRVLAAQTSPNAERDTALDRGSRIADLPHPRAKESRVKESRLHFGFLHVLKARFPSFAAQ